MDRACADVLETVLLLGGGTALLSAIGTAIAKASLAAGVAAAGGWIGLAIIAAMVYWGLMISFNKTANGVCIIHYLPWTQWFMPIPGYAQGT
jgi:hypothetical protein